MNASKRNDNIQQENETAVRAAPDQNYQVMRTNSSNMKESEFNPESDIRCLEKVVAAGDQQQDDDREADNLKDLVAGGVLDTQNSQVSQSQRFTELERSGIVRTLGAYNPQDHKTRAQSFSSARQF